MILMREDSWETFKKLIATKELQIQYHRTQNSYQVFGPDSSALMWTITLPYGSSAAIDFETNYLASANQKIRADVKTPRDRDDILLHAVRYSAAVSTQDGSVAINIKVPGTFAGPTGDGRYIALGEAFFNKWNVGDSVTGVTIIDIDNVSGQGANTVLGTYHDPYVDASNQGWSINPTGFVKIRPIGAWRFVPSGLYLRVTAQKGGLSFSDCTFFANIRWGKYYAS